ncbi:MAG: LysM peptidoglycan-binding domain-containing protein, partial [Acidimicrobiia bacterium]|nr:LysM peptidoglycan-binding domain-containing protein [Acidimicrobiia bacterium]
SEIARAHQTTVRAIANANDINDVDLIRVGQMLDVDAARSRTSSGSTYVVRAGDTLARIAARHGTSIAAIVTANDLSNPNSIRIGQRLTIPTSGAPEQPPAAPTATTHTVKAGETLGQIASRYGVSASSIAAANDLADPHRIRVGQRLTIPGATSGGGDSTPSMTCPVPGAIFINDWGFPRTGGRFHQGTDLFAPRDTPVRAPVSGVVEAVTGDVGGFQFWLTGDDGNLYVGTHMQRFGQVGRVDAGDVVGSVGDTGNAKGAKTHLHFEILVGGKAVNPYPALVRACR